MSRNSECTKKDQVQQHVSTTAAIFVLKITFILISVAVNGKLILVQTKLLLVKNLHAASKPQNITVYEQLMTNAL